MAYNTYIQQIKTTNGTTYSKGSVVDILAKFKIACQEFPFQKHPKHKELATNDWYDEHGQEVYVPDTLPMSHYDIEATFMYKGSETDIRNDISDFIDFLQGRKKGANADTVQSARLAIYNDYVGFGRKDVVVAEVSNSLFYIQDSAVDALAQFKVKFTVYDPITEVTKTTSQQGVVTDLSFTS